MTKIKPIATDVLAKIVKELNGEFVMPTSNIGCTFLHSTAVAACHRYANTPNIESGGELRDLAPGFGVGSTLDLLTPQHMAEMIAEIRAYTFEGTLPELEIPEGFPPFVVEMRELLMGVHDDIYSAIGFLLDNKELAIAVDGFVHETPQD